MLWNSLLVNAQAMRYEAGKSYNESVDSAAVSSQIIASLRKLVPNAKDISWGHVFCSECPKDGTYSYYQAEFYQGDEQGSITFNEGAQPVAFSIKAELSKMPKVVQAAIGKRVKKLEQDFEKIQLEITSFNVKEKIFYGVEFYIPTEDKKHWTPYDKLVFNEGGNISKMKDSE